MAVSTAYVNQILPKDAARVAIPGHVIQVQSNYFTQQVSTSNTSFTSTGLSVNITPLAVTSKFLVIISGQMYINTTGGAHAYAAIYRNGNNIYDTSWVWADTSRNAATGCLMKYDTPSTIAQLTYEIYIRAGAGTAFWNGSGDSDSSITVMEIAQ